MKRLPRQILTYTFPLLCLLALTAAVIVFRSPDHETKALPDEIALLGDLDLRDPLDDILQAFQRRYGIRVRARYETRESTRETRVRSNGADVLLTVRPVRNAMGRERILETIPIARRASHPLTGDGESEIIMLHRLDGAAPPEMLDELVRYMTGASAGEILARHGYAPLKPAERQ